MNEGKYVYCIVGSAEPTIFDDVGLFGKVARTVGHKDIGAVVSPVPYTEIEASIDNILVHQRVVEAARKVGTALPVKFGTIFRSEDGVSSFLRASYEEYSRKLRKLKGMDEFGVKVLFNKTGMARMINVVEHTSPDIVKMRKSLEKSRKGKSYFTRLKMSEAIKSEAYRRIDQMSHEIYEDLSKNSQESSVLKSEHEQIVLNAAYLVKSEAGKAFLGQASLLGKEYAEHGLIVHSSGPWAPYSFC
jgi:hypothetical protein